jgi:hypothetical protein
MRKSAGVGPSHITGIGGEKGVKKGASFKTKKGKNLASLSCSSIKIPFNNSNIHDGDANGQIHNDRGHIQESSRPSLGLFLFLFSFFSLP